MRRKGRPGGGNLGGASRWPNALSALSALVRRVGVAWLAALTALGLVLVGPAQADTGHPRAPRVAPVDKADPNHARVIVKYRDTLVATGDALRRPQRAAAWSQRLALPVRDGRVLGDRVQALQADGIDSAGLARRLAAQSDVEWAVVDQRRYAQAVLPNDPLFPAGQGGLGPAAGQWYLRAPDATVVSATNAIGGWALSTGSPAITVAVLDTGVRLSHPDLASKLRPGYDFIANHSDNFKTAADGNGRDADATDPGDWTTDSDSCGAGDSSWHGTQVAGLIGAASDNGIGMAGLARDVMVLPVRVLGKCGGYDSDILAAMRWAGGIANDPYVNPYPARVINLSLGSSGSCPSSYASVLQDLNAAGVVVVVAAGNDVGQAVNSPANCAGVIAVTGIRHVGTKVGYSNIGPEASIAAPAGNCVNISAGSPCLYPLLTTINSGSTNPATDTYSDSYNASLGTSFATPLVAGAAALMLSLDPGLSPAEVKATLQNSSRPFPTTGGTDADVVACVNPAFTRTEQLECYCTTTTCGAGMLDVGAAMASVQAAQLAPTAVISPGNATLTVGNTLAFSGQGSAAGSGRSIATYRWSLSVFSGDATLLGATDGSAVTVSAIAPGSAVLSLVVTDSTGATATSAVTLALQAVAPTPTPTTPVAGGSSGGGAIAGGAGWGWLGALALIIAALGRRPDRGRGPTASAARRLGRTRRT